MKKIIIIVGIISLGLSVLGSTRVEAGKVDGKELKLSGSNERLPKSDVSKRKLNKQLYDGKRINTKAGDFLWELENGLEPKALSQDPEKKDEKNNNDNKNNKHRNNK